MKPYLLDVNLLIALSWPSHVHYHPAQDWFAAKRKCGFRTSPLTQAGFVRISSNPSFTADAAPVAVCMQLLERIVAMPEHEFWPDDLAVADALNRRPVVTHRQITDAYLLALAEKRDGVVATLDRGLLGLAGKNSKLAEIVA